MLVRDIIDIDSTYEDFEALDEDDELKINKKSKSKKIKIKTKLMMKIKKMIMKILIVTKMNLTSP